MHLQVNAAYLSPANGIFFPSVSIKNCSCSACMNGVSGIVASVPHCQHRGIPEYQLADSTTPYLRRHSRSTPSGNPGVADEPGDAIRENSRDLAKLSEMQAVSNNICCPRLSLPTSICSARGDENSAFSFGFTPSFRAVPGIPTNRDLWFAASEIQSHESSTLSLILGTALAILAPH